MRLRPGLLSVAFALSALLHGLILFVEKQSPSGADRPPKRIEASLTRPAPVAPPDSSKSAKKASPVKPKAEKPRLALDRKKSGPTSPSMPEWSAAEKQEMNDFLDELDSQKRPPPRLAQRSLAMARELGREQARQDGEENVTLERLPNSPPVDPFSLELYLDALVKKLNRSAAFVPNDPRAKGARNALVRIKLNSDGSLRSFQVLNAADQQDEIAFIRAVVERAVPFASFPADLQKSARSLGMLICIRPANSSSTGSGFSRNTSGGSC